MSIVHVSVVNLSGNTVEFRFDDEIENDVERIAYLKKLVTREELESVKVNAFKSEDDVVVKRPVGRPPKSE